jgi:hypothetical protein
MFRLVLAACLVCAACTPLPAGAAPTPSRNPATLPVFPEEAVVVAALDAAGIRVTRIGQSKFQAMLGKRERTRVFDEAPGAAGAGGADVLFLERPINNVRVCVSKAASGLNRYDIFIGDRLLSSGEASQEVFYSMSGRYFIQAFGKRFSDALMAGLGTVTPPC